MKKMKKRLFTGIAALAGAFLLSFSMHSDNKVANYDELKAEIEHRHEGESKWFPCHPAGDIGPCGHFNVWGYPIHTADVYPCGHVCY